MLPQNSSEHPYIRDGRFHLMGNVAYQPLDRLFVPLALTLSLAHDIKILQKLSLYLRGETVLIGTVALRLAAGHQSVQGRAEVVAKRLTWRR